MVVHYLFDGDLTDETTNGNDGTALGDVNLLDIGIMTVANDDANLLTDYNAVEVGIDGTLFAGKGQEYSVYFKAQYHSAYNEDWEEVIPTVSTLFGVSRERIPANWADEVGGQYTYDPCAEDVNNDPNCYGVTDPDPNWCDESLPIYGFGDTHGLAIFAWEPYNIIVDRFYMGEAAAAWEVDWVDVVHTYYEEEGEEGTLGIHTLWINGEPENVLTGEPWGEELGDPNVPDPCDDTVHIGMTLNGYPGEEGIPFLNGDVNEFRVYEIALSEAEILWLTTRDTTPVEYLLDELLEPNPNMNSTPYDANQIINFFDEATFAPQWMIEKLFE